jgi:hypothetical protein
MCSLIHKTLHWHTDDTHTLSLTHTQTHTLTHSLTHTHSEPAGDLAHGEADSLASEVELEMQVRFRMYSQYPLEFFFKFSQ